jgi:hypothetical protein
MHYHTRVIEDNIYDRWFRLNVNVIHTRWGKDFLFFIDEVQKYVAPDLCGTDRYLNLACTQGDNSYILHAIMVDNIEIYNKS